MHGATLSCPNNGDLHDTAALDAMLAARASPARELLIMVLGWTNGKSQITMRDEGVHFIETQIASLRLHGVSNYLVLTPDLNQSTRKGGTSNMCLSRLRPRGVCCSFSRVGMHELAMSERKNQSWGMFATHPYMLFLQRWWFTTHALVRGYSILSMDSDLHLSSNPFQLVHSRAFAAFEVLFQGDGGWPVRDGKAETPSRPGSGSGRMSTRVVSTYRDGDEVGVSCTRRVHSPPPAGYPCPCSVTAAPSLNTGFVFARASAGLKAAALFNATVQTILARLNGPPVRDSWGVIHQGRLWPQAVMNEQVFLRAQLPKRSPPLSTAAAASHISGSSARGGDDQVPSRVCHPLDVECLPARIPKTADQMGVRMPRTWWVRKPRSHSVWMASEWRPAASDRCSGISESSGGGGSRPRSHGSSLEHAPAPVPVLVGSRQAEADGPTLEAELTIRPPEEHLIAHTDVAFEELPNTLLRVAVLPRMAVGRLCGVRKIPLASLHGVQTAPLPCSAYAKPSFLGIGVQHLQFASLFTRMHVFHALRWYPPGRTVVDGHEGPARARVACPSTPAALEARLPNSSTTSARTAVLIGTTAAKHSILCATDENGFECPCCWLAPESLAKETTGCPHWRPNA